MSSTPPSLGVVQIPVLRDVAECEPWLTEIASRPAPGLWLFPELFAGGFEFGGGARLAELAELNAIMLARFARFADETGHALAGSFLTRRGEVYVNALMLCLPNEEPRALWTKLHLFPGPEADCLSPGEPQCAPVIWQGLRLGGLVCFDLRFPEAARLQAAAGLDVMLVPSQWPASRAEHLEVLLTARCIENQCWVLACNGCGPSALGLLGGGSRCIAPGGRLDFAMGDSAGVRDTPHDPEPARRSRLLFDSSRSPLLEVRPRER